MGIPPMGASKYLLMALLMISILPTSAQAERVKYKEFGSVTDESVEAYYNILKKLHRKSYEDYKAFTYDHTDEHAQITVNMIHHPPNGKDQKKTVVMNKEKLMASLPETYKFSLGAKVQHKLLDIEVAGDGKSATIKNIVFISTVIDMPSSKGATKVDVRTQSNCTNHLIGDPLVGVKVDKSVCTTESFFFPRTPAPIVLPSPKPSEDKP